GAQHENRLFQRVQNDFRREQILPAGQVDGRGGNASGAHEIELLSSRGEARLKRRTPRVTWRDQPPNGIGPRCSARGPSAATGRNRSAPTMAIVPRSRKPNVQVSSLIVPSVTGASFLRPSEKAMAIGAMMGR